MRQLAPESWTKSFTKVNLHPHHRVSFEEWCKRIAHHLQGGLSFKPEAVLNPYAMLPSFWHGTLPEEKKQCMEILKSHNSVFTVACVRELHTKMHIPLPDMQNLRVCLQLAIEHPAHLGLGSPGRAVVEQPSQVAAASSALADINEGLRSFQLHPKAADGQQLFTGLAKFEHLVKLTRRSTSRVKVLSPSPFLDVEVSSTQQELLDPSPVDFMMNAIASTMIGDGAKQARRRAT